MRQNRWLDWLRSQRHWAMLVRSGYMHHSCESVFLTIYGRDLDCAIEWTQ